METPQSKSDLARHVTVLFALLLLLLSGLPGGFAQDCTDDRVEQGIKLYDEGKFDKAIQELRSVTRRLGDGPRSDSASQCLFKANLYIGMAYLGTGKEGQDKECFMNAAKTAPCIPLNPDQYPPKVISFYDDACKRLPRLKPIGQIKHTWR